MRFDTNKYLASHGKTPRGYGMWIFAEEKDTKYGPDHLQRNCMVYTGMYSACKKEAAAYFGKHNDVFSLVVMP